MRANNGLSEGDEHCSPDRVIRELIRRLGRRRQEVVAATGGDSLRVQVTVAEARSQSFRVVVTSTGLVSLLEPENLTGEEFRPQLVLVGTTAELLAVIVGSTPWRTAIDAGTVVPYVDPVGYESLREVVATELLDLLDETA